MTAVLLAAAFLVVLAVGLAGFVLRCRVDRHPGFLPDEVYRRRM